MGGYELSCADVVRQWRRRGHDVRVLTGRATVQGAPPAEDDGFVERRLSLRYEGPSGTTYPTGRAQVHSSLLRDHWALRRELRRRPDVVSVWSPSGLSLSLLDHLAKVPMPVVFVVCDHWPYYAPRIDPTRRWLARIGRTPVDLGTIGRWIFCSESLRRNLIETSPFSFADTDVSFLGVDLATFELRPAEERPWRWRLLYVGRVTAEKGTETAVRALAHLPAEATLEVIGHADPDERDRIQGVADKMGVGDRLRFDEVERAALPARYRDADVVVFPSEWDEPFGIVPLEAMASATPVVATGAGGSAEYLRHEGNCLLYPGGDAAGLAAAVRRLVDDRDLRQRVVSGGHATAAELTTERLADHLESLHRGAVDAHGNRQRTKGAV